MRVINVIVIKNSVVDSIDSFGIEEEQLSDAVVEDAEKLFKEKVLAMSGEGTEEEFEDNCGDIESYLEDGYYKLFNSSVCLTWSDI